MSCIRFCWLGEVSWEVCIVNWNSVNTGVIFSLWEFRRTGNKTMWAWYLEVGGVRGEVLSSLSIFSMVIIYLGFLSIYKAILKSLMLKNSSLGKVLAWAAVINYYRLDGLNYKCLFLMVLETVKSKIKTQKDPVSGEGLIPVFQMIVFSLYLHMEARERANSSPFLIRALIPSGGLDPHDLITSQTPITHHPIPSL